MIMKCDCEHEFQDKVYGKGNRVHNYRDKDNNYICTVCGSIKTASGTKQSKGNKK